MRGVVPVVMLVVLLVLGCGRHAPPPPPLDNPGRMLEAKYDSLGLEEFLTLDADSRRLRAEAADGDFLALLRHREELARYDIMERSLPDGGVNDASIQFTENVHNKKRVDTLVQKLHRAVITDPAHAEAWYELGRLQDLIGDYDRARRSQASALRAIPHDRRHGRPAELAAACRIAAAWSCRDLGLWREGLGWLEVDFEALGDLKQEAQLVAGLLHAGAGHFREAYDLSMDLGAIRYDHKGYKRRGFGKIGSNYGRAWIQAMAWLHQGDAEMAHHALGERLSNRADVPFMRRYWNDVGLICELTGRLQRARDAYGLAVVGERVMMPYVPWEGFSIAPVILDEPDLKTPFFTVFDSNYFAGSLFSFAAQLMIECGGAETPALQAARGRDAEQAFTICMRRGVRPVLSQALRGRTRFYVGDMAGAEQDLLAACEALDETGTPDAASCLVLGTVQLNDGRTGEATAWLRRAVEADPGMAGAWRTLGAVLAMRGRVDEAFTAMNRALELDPERSTAWYNRGLLNAEQGRWAEASVDLGVTVRLAPWYAKARDLLQRASLELRDSGREADIALAAAEAEELAGELDLVSAGRFEERPGVIVLGEAGRRRTPAPPTDFAALADSLAHVYSSQPDHVVRRSYADALIRIGRSDEALDLFTLDEDQDVPNEDLVLLLRADRDRADASRALALARSLGTRGDAADPELWSLVAMTCLEADHRDEGLQALDRAITLDPSNEGLKAYRAFLDGAEGP